MQGESRETLWTLFERAHARKASAALPGTLFDRCRILDWRRPLIPSRAFQDGTHTVVGSQALAEAALDEIQTVTSTFDGVFPCTNLSSIRSVSERIRIGYRRLVSDSDANVKRWFSQTRSSAVPMALIRSKGHAGAFLLRKEPSPLWRDGYTPIIRAFERARLKETDPLTRERERERGFLWPNLRSAIVRFKRALSFGIHELHRQGPCQKTNFIQTFGTAASCELFAQLSRVRVVSRVARI